MESFDQIAQELFKQKQRMDALEAENQELRRQLTDLRAGRGISVDINRVRVASAPDVGSLHNRHFQQ